MKVLLVYPKFPDTYWSLRHAVQLEGRRAAIPPLGLMTVVALLPQAWERRLIDMNVRSLTSADLAWADMVFISAMRVQHDSMRQVIEQAKAAGKRIVVGGPYPSEADGYAEALEYFAGADHIFIGEAEATLPEFVQDLERGETKPLYQAAERPSLLTTPLPEFHLAELNRYSVRQRSFIRESAIPVAMLGLLVAPLGTPLWERLKREGRLLRDSTGDNTNCSLNFVPKMNPARLIAGYKETFRAIYSAPEYYARALASLERVKQARPEPERDGLLHQLLSFARIVLTLGIRDHDRREFWHYLREVLQHHRAKFGQAVRLAALGYHFRRLAEFNGKAATK